MTCLGCIHYEVCNGEYWFTNNRCQRFKNKGLVTVSLDWDAYNELIRLVESAQHHLKKIRKSPNRESVEFRLDRMESILKGSLD